MQLRWTPEFNIDCDSDRTVFAVGSQVVFDEPTCIALYPESETVVAVGREAAALQYPGQSVLTVSWPIRKGRVAEPVAARLFLQTIVRRAESYVGQLGKILGSNGRYCHPTLISPAQLHVFKQVFSKSGLTRLQPTPSAMAAVAAFRQQKFPAERCLCSFSSDWTECTVFIGSEPVHTTQIEWGIAELGMMVQRVVQESAAAHISAQTANQIVATLINCMASVDPVQAQGKKDVRMSVKAKKSAAATSSTIVLTQGMFTEQLGKSLAPLVEGITTFLERISSDMVTAVSEHGVYLLGSGQDVGGLTSFMSHLFDAEAVWMDDPSHQRVLGMQALGHKH